ncbi:MULTISPECIES: helix-turn-helix domain-containing protein [unclassified Streptomyces]|uniref:nSTAND1 domain-containing NTPase n=1 Tax=unclassified Streptomyces TaxID=2593676 RepID=UPI002365FE7D|nr:MULTISPECIES: helix-turn-helix domain-containing protein [unclassified Streptomyces]MDF3140430.1 helix-turn-helix domain-containing protein [Streptomyces sp. T21Q-yed]WDF35814.1 helix-turn-helix domain-containing protein [Streptomyces sp. T12]
MGRPELPVDAAAGPVQRLAHDLRELRRSAGGVSYRAMAKKAGFSVTTLAKAASGERLPSLAVLRAYVQACGVDPVPWEARWAEAEALAGEERQEDADAAPPYLGLARFEPDDRELFFGRDRLIDELSELGYGSPFAVVFGASGSGKSSLLRAGLIPLLREKIAQQGRTAVLRILTPGARPATTYGHLLTPTADEPESWVVVDQFEEVFTLCRERAERDRFLDLLLAARDPGSRLRVLIAVRSDFYARCAEHPRLAEALHGSGLLVRPMTADELREAVIGPAQAAGLIVERTLTARIVEDVLDEPGGLPMLSHALLETWRRRKGRMLTLAAYEAAGGVRGAIAASAEEAYGELSPAQAHAARHLLLRMVEPGQGNADTRRPLSWEEMAGWEDPEVRAVAGRLTRARLLTTDDDGVQLAHEALITCWPRLREWIDADRERLRHHRQLTDAARTWLEHDRDPGTLYRGTRLARAEELFAGDDRGYDGLTSEETAFLVTAAEQRATEERAATRARRRSRTLTASLCAVLAVALVVGLTAVRLRQDSEKQTTDTAARRVAAVAEALRTTDPRTAMLLGVAAWRISPLPESRRALLGALAQPELGNFTDPAPGDEPNRYLDSSGRTLLSIGDNTWRTWDVGTHRRIASGPVPHGAILGAGPGGRVLVIQTAQQTQRLWDTRTRRWIGGPLPFRDTVTFGASGRNYLVRSPDDDRAGLYSVTDGHLVFRTPSAGRGELAHAAADDRLLAVCPPGRAPQVWDTSTRSVRSGGWTSARGVCGDGAFLGLTGGRLLALAGDRVRVWDTASGRELANVAHQGADSAVVSADGSFLATGGGQEIRVWRLPSGGAPVFRHSLDNETLSDLAWDSSRPLLRYLEGGTVHTLDLTTTLTRAWRTSPLTGVRLSPDGRTLATAERIGDRHVFRLRSTRDGRLLRTLPDPSHPAFRTGTPTVPADVTEPLLSFSPDGGVFAYGVSAVGWDTVPQRLTVWDVAAGRAKTTVDLATASAMAPDAIALGPGGRTLLTARLTDDGIVNETWDTTQRRRTALLPGPAGRHLAVSRDGGLLVTDNRVVRAGRSHAHDLVQHDDIAALAFAPDGSGLAAGDSTGRVAVWDGDLRHRAGILRNVFLAPVDPSSDSAETITALAFSPDGSTLAVGGDAGTVQLWDISTQQPLGPSLPSAGESVDTLAFSPDSTMLYAGGKHVPLQRYVVDPDRAVSLVCSRAGNAELTRAQWRTYVPDRPYMRVCP